MPNQMIDSNLSLALSRFLDVDVARYQLIATNLANVDTPGYRTRDLDFRAELERADFDRAEFDRTDFGRTDDAAGDNQLASFTPAPVAHAVRGLMQRPDGNNVSVERETLLLAETQMKFNVGVQLLKDEFRTIATAINSGGGTSS